MHGELGLHSAWSRHVWQTPVPTAATPGSAVGLCPACHPPCSVLGGRIHPQLHTCSASSCPAPEALISPGLAQGSGSAHLPAAPHWWLASGGKQGGTWHREWDKMSPAVLTAGREPGRAQHEESIIQQNQAGAHGQHVGAQPERGTTAPGAAAPRLSHAHSWSTEAWAGWRHRQVCIQWSAAGRDLSGVSGAAGILCSGIRSSSNTR